MTRWIAGLIVLSSMVGGASAFAQEASPGPGKAEVAIISGGIYGGVVINAIK